MRTKVRIKKKGKKKARRKRALIEKKPKRDQTEARVLLRRALFLLQIGLDGFDHFKVGRKPRHRVEFGVGEPLHRLVLDELDRALDDRREEAVHREVKVRVVAFDRDEKLLGRDAHAQLFFDLADDGLFGRFAGLHLAARELPAVLELSVSALRGEDLSVVMDDGGDDFNGFHGQGCKKIRCGNLRVCRDDKSNAVWGIAVLAVPRETYIRISHYLICCLLCLPLRL